MADHPNYITPAGFKRVTDELEQLQRVERPRVVHEVSEAAAQGDRSENAEYIYGKKRLREIDRRVYFLLKRTETMQVIDPAQQKGPRVVFGALVDVENEDGKALTFQIVGEDETEPAAGRISWRSPLGRALLGKQADDDAVLHKPDGTTTEYAVIGVRFPKPQ